MRRLANRFALRRRAKGHYSRLCRLGLESLEPRNLLAIDAFELNNSFATASPLPAIGSQTVTSLSIDPGGDQDFYIWKASVSGGATIDLNFISSQGDIDLEVFQRINPTTGILLGSSHGIGNRERVNINVTAAQEYVIKAYPAFLAGLNPNYTLQIAEIPNDALESNNSLATATNLGSTTPSFANLSLHSSTDQDLFKYQAPAGGLFTVETFFTNANGNIDLALLDGNGVEIQRSASATNGEHLTAPVIAGDFYYVRVFSENDEPNANYNIDFSFGQQPAIQDIDTQSIFQGQTLRLPLVVSDVDTPFESLVFSAVSDNPAFLPTGQMSIDRSSGAPVLVIPTTGTGNVNVTVTVQDPDGGMASDTFLFRVLAALNFAPTISNIANQAVFEDTSTGPIPVTVTDLAAPASAIVLSAASSDPTVIPVGNILFGGTNNNRTVEIIPGANRHGGPVTITVTATDALGMTAVDTFDIIVGAVADGPNLSVSDANGAEDSAIPLSILSSLVDADGSEALAIRISNVPNGATLSAGSFVGGGAWLLTPSQLAGLTITPPHDFAGNFTLNVAALSTEASNSSSATTNGSINVSVSQVNDAPSISFIPSQSTPIGVAKLDIPFTVGDGAGETDPAALQASATSSVQSIVANGGISFGGSGANRTISLTPQPGASGLTTITVTVLDDQGAPATRQFVLNVGVSNSNPTISGVSNASIGEDSTTGALPFTVNDGQTTPSSLIVVGSSSNPTLVPDANIVIAHGGGGARTVTVTPLKNQTGSATITLLVDDGQGGTAVTTFNVNVSAVDDFPAIGPVANVTISEDQPTTAISVVVSDEETSANVLMLTATSNNTTLIPNGNIQIGPLVPTGGNRHVVITPAANQFGTATITLSVRDQANNVTTRTFNVTVTPVNDAPAISAIANQTISENSTVGPIPFTIGDVETSANSLTVTVASSNQALIRNSDFTIGGSGANRTLTLTSQPNQLGGPLPITVSVSDGVLTTTRTFTLTVIDVNLPPQLAEAVASIPENTANTTAVFDVDDVFTDMDKDRDGTPLTYTIVSGNTGGAFAVNPTTGVITVANSAALDYETTPSFALFVRASDGLFLDAATITINLANLNDNSPIINDDSATIGENTSDGSFVKDVSDAFTSSDVDRDAAEISYAIIAGNIGGAFVIDPGNGDIRVANSNALDREKIAGFTLVVQATDGTFTDTANISVNLTDEDDNSPLINDASTSLVAAAANGTNVFNLNDANTDVDADLDGAALTYAITAGNISGAFAIHPMTGQITVASSAALDIGVNPNFALTIQASDGFHTDTAVISVKLVASGANPNSPLLANATAPALAEHSANGTSVFNVNNANTGNDVDTDGQALTYAITGGNPNGVFAINATTGVITVANSSLLDHETHASYALKVRGTDGTFSSTATITINLTNTNDNSPVIDDHSTSIIENSPNTTFVFDVNEAYSDGDSDRDGNGLTYTIISGNASGVFAISPFTGVVSVANAAGLNYESTTAFGLVVQASDGAFTDTATIMVHVVNANDNAPIVSDGVVALPENTAFGTAVFNLNDAATTSDSDRDGQPLLYAILSGNKGAAFAINPTTGAITVSESSALDFETNPSFSLVVQATDGVLVDTATIVVNLGNMNENPPLINDQSVSLDENTPTGTFVLDVDNASTGSDLDPDGQPITYSIVSGNTGGAFSINPTTGEMLVANGAALDFEVNPSFMLVVQASDGALTDQALIIVNLNNLNDGAPLINDASPSLAENSANGTIVFDVNDANSGGDVDIDGQALTYSFAAGGNPSGAFAIDSTTGQITVANGSALNFELVTSFTLVVQATDGLALDSATIQVSLSNVNEAPTVTPATFSLAENSANGTTVGTVAGTDPDASSTLAWSITAGNTGGAFAINPTTGQITVAAAGALNFETTPSFSLTVQATDNGAPALNGTATVTINLTNVNEAPTVTPATFSLAENSANGTTVGTVAGTDPDASSTLAWSITAGNTGGAFAINPTTGQITVAAAGALNFETTPSFSLTVQATDNGAPALNGTATVTINLTNVNEAPTVTPATFSLAENSANGTTVGTVAGTDPDASSTLAWSITAGNTGGAFAINPTTGQITVAAAGALNFETTPSFSLTVQATDNGAPALNGTATVTINLTNVNEAPTVTPATFSLAENSANGTTVGTVAGTDPDASSTLAWSITAGNTGGAFAINPTTGQITVAAAGALNFETTPSFSLTVQATDNGAPALNGTATVTINLTNVNEAPTVTPATFSLAENSANGTTVGTVAGTDPDASSTLAWSITAGNTGGAFAINPTTGQITVAAAGALNFETTPSFSLTVQATDNGAPALNGTATVTINLIDVNENFGPGDYDRNHVVNGTDITVWRSQFGQIGANLSADGDVDGDVDGNDFFIIQLNMGRVTSIASVAVAAMAPAPEESAPSPEGSSQATGEPTNPPVDSVIISGPFSLSLTGGDRSRDNASASRGARLVEGWHPAPRAVWLDSLTSAGSVTTAAEASEDEAAGSFEDHIDAFDAAFSDESFHPALAL